MARVVEGLAVTCIIATPAGIWGDRMITANTGERCDPCCKIARNEGLVAGFAGPFGGILAGCDAVKDDETNVRALAKLLDARVTGLAVKDGRIYVLEYGKAFRRPLSEAFYAVGSGAECAMAYLAGRGSASPDDVRKAHQYVASSRDDCGRGVDFGEAP